MEIFLETETAAEYFAYGQPLAEKWTTKPFKLLYVSNVFSLIACNGQLPNSYRKFGTIFVTEEGVLIALI